MFNFKKKKFNKKLEQLLDNVREKEIFGNKFTLYPDQLEPHCVISNFKANIYPFTGSQFVIIKRTEHFIISWEHYLRGSVVGIFDKSDIADTTNTDNLYKNYKPIISYVDQTPSYGCLIGVHDIDINNYDKLNKIFEEINI